MKKGTGIYIGQKEVIGCVVSLAKGTPVIDKFAIEPIQELKASEEKKSPQKITSPEGRAVSRALQRMGALRRNVILAFNPVHLATRYCEMPLIPLEEQQRAISYEAGRFIPFKMEEAVSDFRSKPKQNKEGKKLLSITYTAAKTEVVHRYIQSVRQAPARTEAVEPVFSSLTRILSLFEKEIEALTYGLIFIDTENVNITLIHGGMAHLSHDFLLTEDRPTNETRFHQGLKSSLEYIYRIWGIQSVNRVFLAGNGELRSWKDFLTGVFKNEIIFELGTFPGSKNMPPEEVGKFLVAIGLALRNLKLPSPLGDLLLIPSLSRRIDPEQIKKFVLQEFFLIALFSILLRLGILEPYAAYLKKQGAGLIGLNTIEEPDLKTQLTPQLEHTHNQLKARIDVIAQYSKEKSLLSQKLRMLGRLKPPSIWLEGLSYGEEAGGPARSRSQGPPSTPAPGAGPAPRKFSFQGHCYLADPQQEVQTINDWAKVLNDDKEFMEGLQKITVAEVRQGKFQDQDTTTFQIIVE